MHLGPGITIPGITIYRQLQLQTRVARYSPLTATKSFKSSKLD